MNLKDYKNAVMGIDLVRLTEDLIDKHKGNYNLEKSFIDNLATLEGEQLANEVVLTLQRHRQVITAIYESYSEIEAPTPA